MISNEMDIGRVDINIDGENVILLKEPEAVYETLTFFGGEYNGRILFTPLVVYSMMNLSLGQLQTFVYGDKKILAFPVSESYNTYHCAVDNIEENK